VRAVSVPEFGSVLDQAQVRMQRPHSRKGLEEHVKSLPWHGAAHMKNERSPCHRAERFDRPVVVRWLRVELT
jgi:hypothetical protein